MTPSAEIRSGKSKLFNTRLSDDPSLEPLCVANVVSMIAMGREGQHMSQLSSGISRRVSTGLFGGIGIALALTFSAVQFASGRDLGVSNPGSEGSVNRAAKADRAGRAAGAVVPMKTISFRLKDMPDTSVLVRLPVERDAANDAAVAPAATKSVRKPTLACEPVVSVLTEVAKQLQPGRCIT
jgi:hypothetical protein